MDYRLRKGCWIICKIRDANKDGWKGMLSPLATCAWEFHSIGCSGQPNSKYCLQLSLYRRAIRLNLPFRHGLTELLLKLHYWRAYPSWFKIGQRAVFPIKFKDTDVVSVSYIHIYVVWGGVCVFYLLAIWRIIGNQKHHSARLSSRLVRIKKSVLVRNIGLSERMEQWKICVAGFQ